MKCKSFVCERAGLIAGMLRSFTFMDLERELKSFKCHILNSPCIIYVSPPSCPFRLSVLFAFP